ncbi:MAG: DNA mismatch repair endonuclease MutL [Chlamydiota bacterium]
MPSAICVLPEVAINQIAAGEVIENPASVVKELVENAIDADSTSIRIDLQRGGLESIRVADDGIGMTRSDLTLCFQPHATSKIRSTEDLNAIASMGFRGEALASIGAIGCAAATSSPRRSKLPLGAQITVEGGKQRPMIEVARTPGTTVEVAQLFYNVPVRKTFQKSAGRCLTDVIKVITQIALAYPQLHIELYADKKEIFTTLPGKGAPFQKALKQAIKATLGEPFLKGLTFVQWRDEELKVEGYLGMPHLARASRSGQFLVINKRPVTNSLVRRAIYEGYGTRLATHTHPLFVLHLTMPASWVDVNVHPQKREIRLRHEEKVKQALRAAVIRGLETDSPSPFLPDKKTLAAGSAWLGKQELPALKLCEKEDNIPLALPLSSPSGLLPVIGLFSSLLILDGSKWLEPPVIPYLNQVEDQLIFIDLEGAEKRIFYEAILAQKEKKEQLQGLLTPIPVTFTPHESHQVERHFSELISWGIGLRPFGNHSYLIDALAPRVDESRAKELILELTEALDRFGEKEQLLQAKWEQLAVTMCRYRRTRRNNWTLEEGREVGRQLLRTAAPYHTPTGKPTMGSLSYDWIKKLFR